jgi:hypothetical protein
MQVLVFAVLQLLGLSLATIIFPDPAGEVNVGNGIGKQFIGGRCISNRDCASGCCAVLRDIGICSGPSAAFVGGKAGCGFVGPRPTTTSSKVTTTTSHLSPPPAQTSGRLTPDPAGVKNIGNGRGAQFIGGQCLSNADCTTACCATSVDIGICSAIAAQFAPGKTGCGFKAP